jgi:hypothetical protein
LKNAMLLSARTGGAFDPTLGDSDALLLDGDDPVPDSLTVSRPGVRFDAGLSAKGMHWTGRARFYEKRGFVTPCYTAAPRRSSLSATNRAGMAGASPSQRPRGVRHRSQSGAYGTATRWAFPRTMHGPRTFGPAHQTNR